VQQKEQEVLLALGEKGTPQVPFAASSGAGSLSQSSSLSAPPPTKKVDYSQPSFSFNVTVTRFRWILKEVRTRHAQSTRHDTTRRLECAWSWRGA
jgi:hypothetical protein